MVQIQNDIRNSYTRTLTGVCVQWIVMYGVYVWLSCACLQNDRYVYLTVYVHRLTGVCV